MNSFPKNLKKNTRNSFSLVLNIETKRYFIGLLQTKALDELAEDQNRSEKSLIATQFARKNW
jgi:hypothetical protein